MGISWDDAQTLDTQSAPAQTNAPPQAPAPAQAMSWDEAQAADTTPANAPTHPTEAPSGNALADAGNFLRTAAIHAGSGLASLIGGADPTTRIAAGIAKPAQPIPNPASAEQIDDAAFKTGLGPEYQPQTLPGRLAMGGTVGAISSLATPVAGAPGFLANLARGVAAGTAGQGASEAGLPAWMGPAATAFLELAGRAGYGGLKAGAPGVSAVKQVVASPSNAGANAAGRVLQGVDNTGAALPAVSDADLTGAAADVRGATTAIADKAAPDFQVGQQVRDDLTTRADALKQARTDASDAGYDAFRQQLPVASSKLAPFMSSPSFRAAVRDANGAVLDEGGKPLSDYWDFNEAGDPIRLKNAAVPPDVLDRVRSKLGENIGNAAKQGQSAARTASTLADRFGDFLEENYPGYADIRAQFKENSRPLDALNTGAPAKVIESNRPYGGAPQYPLPAERVPDLFLRGPAVKTNLDQLVAAYGGDKAAAESALEQHLAEVAHWAVNPDGTLDAAKFAKAMQPYQKALNGNGGMWFPQLRKSFADAHAAQDTLDTLGAQKTVGNSIATGGLRGDEGHVTASSFNGWLKENGDAVARAQGPAALTRLQQIGNALKVAGKNGGAATAIEDAVPGVVGAVTGGADVGILGSMLGGKVTRALISPWTTRYADAFNAAIEDAVRDPAAARALIAKLPRGNPTPLQTLKAFGATIKPGFTAAPRQAATTAALLPPTSRKQ
jgi:hypothetical protein